LNQAVRPIERAPQARLNPFKEQIMQAIREIIRPKGKSVRISIPSEFRNVKIEILMFPATDQKSTTYDFSAFTGKLDWRGDAVKEQRKLRNEW